MEHGRRARGMVRVDVDAFAVASLEVTISTGDNTGVLLYVSSPTLPRTKESYHGASVVL